MAWLLSVQHTNAMELNLSKIVESDIREKYNFQQHCNADDSFSGNMSAETVVVIITIQSQLVFIVVVFFFPLGVCICCSSSYFC